jgi:hypothetical protein
MARAFWSVSVEVSSSRNPGVSIKPGLIAFTRMALCLKSVVHVRANERGRLGRTYTLHEGKPLLAATDALRMMEPQSGRKSASLLAL